MRVIEQNGWHCRLCGQPMGAESSRRLNNEIVLSLLIPVHHEGAQIAEHLSLIHAETSKTGLPMDMIVIDHGSTESTWHAVEKVLEQIPELKALRFSRNFGK